MGESTAPNPKTLKRDLRQGSRENLEVTAYVPARARRVFMFDGISAGPNPMQDDQERKKRLNWLRSAVTACLIRLGVGNGAFFDEHRGNSHSEDNASGLI